MLLLLVSRALAAGCTPASDGLHDFLICTDHLAYTSAQAACASAGGHLADVEDAAENAWIWAAVSGADATVAWWIGLDDRATEGTFVWDGGATSTYTDWRSGEPNNYGGNEDCTRMPAGGGGVWADADCSLTQPYICESGCLYESAWTDADGDGYGDPDSLTRQCGAPAGTVSNGDDCDDGDPASSPEGVEVCGGGDEDCDGLVDASDPDCDLTDGVDAYRDADGDGVGTGSVTRVCSVGSGSSAVTGDCDDADGDNYPGHAEVPNDGADQDCDGRDDCLHVTDGDHDLAFCTARADWAAAQADCADRGAHLVDVEDAAEDALLYAQLTALDASVAWWTGANDRDVEGTFVWDGGSTSTYTNWRSGEPNDYGGNEDCARWPAGGGGVWTDGDCAVSQPYVCESGCLYESAWLDADGDGYGDPATLTRQCGAPAGTVDNGDDCDDTLVDTHPGGVEVCGSGDEDCDGLEDDADPDVDLSTGVTGYADADADGYGAGDAIVACVLPDGTSAYATDCDDGDATIHPGADELPADGVDADCDGSDGSDGGSEYDGDGDGDDATSGGGTDCDDTDPTVYGGAPERCNGLDDNCDGAVDEAEDGVPACAGCVTVTRDDHVYQICASPTSWTTARDACVTDGYTLADALDGDESRFLYTQTRAVAEHDHAWLGLSATDGAWAWESGAPVTYTAWAPGEPTEALDCARFADASSTEATTWETGDCAEAHPYACELGCAVVLTYADRDGDGYGDPADIRAACDTDPLRSTVAGDCDDADGHVSPAGVEVCDGGDADEDCDGLVDDADPDASGQTTWYRDADGDGYGNDASARSACDPADDEVALGGDCDDTFVLTYPGADEIPDGADNDCDGADASAETDKGAVSGSCGCAFVTGQGSSDHDLSAVLASAALLALTASRRRRPPGAVT